MSQWVNGKDYPLYFGKTWKNKHVWNQVTSNFIGLLATLPGEPTCAAGSSGGSGGSAPRRRLGTSGDEKTADFLRSCEHIWWLMVINGDVMMVNDD